MNLVTRLILACLKHHIFLLSSHVQGCKIVSADTLSRLQVEEFRRLNLGCKPTPTPVPSELSGEFLSNLDALMQAALSPSTVDTYRRAWSLYSQFSQECLDLSVTLPLTVSHICLFIVYMHHKQLAPKTISTTLSAVGYVH